MPASSVAELQQKLIKRLGVDVPAQGGGNSRTGSKDSKNKKQLPRKEQRKAQRQDRKRKQYSRNEGAASGPKSHGTPRNFAPGTSSQVDLASKRKSAQHELPKNINTTASFDSEGASSESGQEDYSEDSSLHDLEEDDTRGAHTSNEGQASQNGEESKPRLSRHIKDKLAQDDAEIEAFERKLGIKKGRKTLPQSFKEDGLDELIGDMGTDSEDDVDDETDKRKRDYEEWLSSKRQKRNSIQRGIDGMEHSQHSHHLESDGEDMTGASGSDEYSDAAFSDANSFAGFESDEEQPEPLSRQKENPYVAPTTGNVAAYVPPSLRKPTESEDENKSRLRKQVQGLVNRLTDANLLSIVQLVDEAYSKNPRGDVTELLTDIILAQVCKPESLPDQFFVLTGGFTAAIYGIVGASFGGHITRRFVEEFGQQYGKANEEREATSGLRKAASNLLTFISQLYVFEVITCKIVFDYMERLLSDLSELNVELLLRICRMTGQLLRKDDPSALKHITSVLNAKVVELGASNISVRTKFMIETIGDLKNSKSKAKGLDSGIVSEHVVRTRKHLGELKSQSKRRNGLAPMGMSLRDVEQADTRGKWWLVGASVPAKPEVANQGRRKLLSADGSGSDFTDDEDLDFVLPDYPEKARSQRLNTTTQIAIFTAIMSAVNPEQGYRQFTALGLKKDDQLEVANVLVQCAGSESPYNQYYSLVGQHACAMSRIRFAFQDRLWKIFRSLGESLFGEQADDEDSAESVRMKDEQRLITVAQFYADLTIDGSLSLAVLKPLELPELNSWTKLFVEQLIIAILQKCRSKTEAKEDKRIEKVFGSLQTLPVLAAGVGWFLRKVIKTKVGHDKALRKLDKVRIKAESMLGAAQGDE